MADTEQDQAQARRRFLYPAREEWRAVSARTLAFTRIMLQGFTALADYIQIEGEYLRILHEDQAGSGAATVIAALRSLEWSHCPFSLQEITRLDQGNRRVFLLALLAYMQDGSAVVIR